LLHASQVSWLNKRPKIDEVLRVGDELDVVVLDVTQSKTSGAYFFSLGHRQTQQNPWGEWSWCAVMGRS
jgi:ribosomal protein S1